MSDAARRLCALLALVSSLRVEAASGGDATGAPAALIAFGDCDPSKIKIFSGRGDDSVASETVDVPNEIIRGTGGPKSLYEIIRAVLHSARVAVVSKTRTGRRGFYEADD